MEAKGGGCKENAVEPNVTAGRIPVSSLAGGAPIKLGPAVSGLWWSQLNRSAAAHLDRSSSIRLIKLASLTLQKRRQGGSSREGTGWIKFLSSRHFDLEAQHGARMVSTAHPRVRAPLTWAYAGSPKSEVVRQEFVWTRPTVTCRSVAQARSQSQSRSSHA